MLYEVIENCRSCGSENLSTVVKLGHTPLSDRLITKEQLQNDDLSAALTTAFCVDCSLFQILETVSPKILFYAEYPYFSSVSSSLLEHFKNSALEIIKSRSLDKDSFVVEAASNDGYMLRNFVDQDIPVLGIEPSDGPARKASEIGIHTRKNFFTKEFASEIRTEFPAGADVFLANNVLAHVPDLNGFVEGIYTVLNDNGVAVIEAPYLVDLIDHCEFDTIYHQHLCYFSVTALVSLFRRHDLFLNKVVRTNIHGGSLRLYIEKKDRAEQSVLELLNIENRRRVDLLEFYTSFANRIDEVKENLIRILKAIKNEGKTIAGYGAAAKANTLMASVGIDNNIIDFIADKNPYKQGKFFSGNKIPILPPEEILTLMPDYLLILAWNFSEEIMQEQNKYSDRGGHFILPIPIPRIV